MKYPDLDRPDLRSTYIFTALLAAMAVICGIGTTYIMSHSLLTVATVDFSSQKTVLGIVNQPALLGEAMATRAPFPVASPAPLPKR
jgi:hypothetical protein